MPVVHSLMGVDVLPAGHPLRVGMIGTYGNRWANIAIARSDLLLVLGSRLDIRQTGADVGVLRRGPDDPPRRLRRRRRSTTASRAATRIEADLGAFLAPRRPLAGGAAPVGRAWLAELAALRDRWPDTAELDGVPGINPNAFMHELARGVAARPRPSSSTSASTRCGPPSRSTSAAGQRFLTSGGMGAMGFALPAAIGAALAVDAPGRDDRRRRRLPAQHPGAADGRRDRRRDEDRDPRQRRSTAWSASSRRATSTAATSRPSWGYSAPDFARVAAAYGIAATTVAEPARGRRRARGRCGATRRRPHLLVVEGRRAPPTPTRSSPSAGRSPRWSRWRRRSRCSGEALASASRRTTAARDDSRGWRSSASRPGGDGRARHRRALRDRQRVGRRDQRGDDRLRAVAAARRSATSATSDVGPAAQRHGVDRAGRRASGAGCTRRTT